MRAVRGVVLIGLLCAGCADPAAREREARKLVYERLSTAEQPVVVGPAVQQDDFAVVDWTRGGLAGGRTLLKRGKGGWVLALCGGAPLKRRPVLERAGVPDGTAGVLVTKLLREESRIDGARRDQIEKWRGAGPARDCPEPRPDDL